MKINKLPEKAILPIDTLVRSIGVNILSSYSLFLGAGSSISSGMPSANTCIWQWKQEIFLSRNPELNNQFSDISSPSVQRRIQQWLDSEGTFPENNSPDEYGRYIEYCYPIIDDRRLYFQRLIEKAKPHLGYNLLCLLSEAVLIRSVWTTNFDGLTQKTASNYSITPIEIGLDTSERVIRQPRKNELLCVALHGDYRYDSLKNTETEIQKQDMTLRNELINHLRDTNLIVIGYSGRDNSIIDTLAEAYSHIGTGRLYWCGYESTEPDERVINLLNHANDSGREAFYVVTSGFDDILTRISIHCLKGEYLKRAREISTKLVDLKGNFKPFLVDASNVERIVKSNAFEIECPSEVYQLKVSTLNSAGAWQKLRKYISNYNIIAVLLKTFVYAIGNIDDIKQAFGSDICTAIERSPIDEKEFLYNDGAMTSLYTQAIIRSLSTIRGLESDNNQLIWSKEFSKTISVANTSYKAYEAILIHLRKYGNKQYIVIKPTIKSEAIDGSDVSDEVDKEIKRQLLTKQYNREFNDILNKWIWILFENKNCSFEFPANSGSTFRFNIKYVPAFAKISNPKSSYNANITEKMQRNIVYSGIQYQEPQLVFSNNQGNSVAKDTTAIRGIVPYMPYDYNLTRKGLCTEVRLGVICPENDAKRLSSYLCALHLTKQPDSKKEYLLEYPGFSQAFGLPISIPEQHNNGWITCPEPDDSLNIERGANELKKNIINCINTLNSKASPNVIIIYIPERWNRWTEYDNGTDKFDLHDFIKAYCVQQGIASQLIRESTFDKKYQGEIVWWLALSIYSKSMRTPWVLENLDENTAFVGLGFSINHDADIGNNIVLGCSHIYNSEGIGLRYKLSKVENPIIRQGNPYLSHDDARRVGDNIRQLFFETQMRLPKRIVIHKRTPFQRQEKEGLLEGLAGIDIVDMLEINIDPTLRFISSRFFQNKPQEDPFPIRRGTSIVLDKNRALLWVHGTAEAINPNQNYYLGKSRIPAPLMIIKHSGTSSLGTIAREILGLSKMDWNSFDLYTKLPSTIQSSNAIARIGALLERFSGNSYDYRLFI